MKLKEIFITWLKTNNAIWIMVVSQTKKKKRKGKGEKKEKKNMLQR